MDGYHVRVSTFAKLNRLAATSSYEFNVQLILILKYMFNLIPKPSIVQTGSGGDPQAFGIII